MTEAFAIVIATLRADAEAHKQKAVEAQALVARLEVYIAQAKTPGIGRRRIVHDAAWLAADRAKRRDRQRERRRLARLAAVSASPSETKPAAAKSTKPEPAPPTAPERPAPEPANGSKPSRPNGRNRRGRAEPSYPEQTLSAWEVDQATGTMSRTLTGVGEKQVLRGEDI